MEPVAKQAITNNRITVIDAIRGITLIGICMTHALQHFGAFTSTAPPPLPWIGTMDSILSWILQYFIMGKFFIIFSFLFGLSFFIQMDNAAKKGIDFRGRFFWRLIILFIIGLIHSALFRNDILIIYALLGVPLIFMYKLSNKWLIAISIFFLLGGAQLSNIVYKSIAPEILSTITETMTERRGRWQEIFFNGSILTNIQHNLSEQLHFKFNFQFGEYGRGYMTMGFFILGLLAGRLRLFEKLEKYKNQIYRLAWMALGAVILLYIIKPILPAQHGNPIAEWLVIPLDNLINLLAAYLWLAVIIVIYSKETMQKKLSKLESYGRMGLTNYMVQSILGVFIFYGYGFGLYDLGIFLSVMICLGYTMLQIQLSHMWLQKFRYGPIEWLWRSGTYLKWQKFIKS